MHRKPWKMYARRAILGVHGRPLKIYARYVDLELLREPLKRSMIGAQVWECTGGPARAPGKIYSRCAGWGAHGRLGHSRIASVYVYIYISLYRNTKKIFIYIYIETHTHTHIYIYPDPPEPLKKKGQDLNLGFGAKTRVLCFRQVTTRVLCVSG